MKKILLTSILAVIVGTTMANATDGDKKVTSKNYVDTAVATKQDLIPVSNITFEKDHITGTIPNTLVTSPTTNAGDIGQYGILDDDLADLVTNAEIYDLFDNNAFRNTVPTTGMVNDFINNELEAYQGKIPQSGYYNDDLAYSNNSWISSSVKGTGLVTKTSEGGVVGERKIIETADVANYGTGTAIEQQIQEISIPTMGAVMAAISNNQVTLPTSTAGNVVTYDANGAIGGSVATYNGSGTYNAGTDANKIATAAAVNTRQAKKVCVGWPDGVTHTDANCWLWELPD
ncbi:MAG: hypothetical protein J5742_02390 [Alphaproteobacteria bacterium]|nr:hypothetical protein [Alphaproteobacteria bacterium]